MPSAVPHPQAAGISALHFRSVVDPSLRDPGRLAQVVAQMRLMNQDRRVTGAIRCDDGQIDQWIEGPEAAVAELWDRIRLDPRHRVQWASAPVVVTTRHFPGSPLKLALTTADLARLGPWLIGDVVPLSDTALADTALAPDPLSWNAVPHDPDSPARCCRLVQSRAASLAAVMTGPDPKAARRALDAMLQDTGLAEIAALVQAVLRDLDASWMAGATTDLQRQLALTLLQSALRLSLDVEEHPLPIGCALVSALPGTPDLCGAMLKVALLRAEGWSVRLLLPQTADRIRMALADLQPDLVVLAGSRLAVRPADQALLRDLLPALAAESRIPVIIGGKLAETDPHGLLRLGATAVCDSLAWIATIAAPFAPQREIDRAPGDAPHRAGSLLATGRARRN